MNQMMTLYCKQTYFPTLLTPTLLAARAEAKIAITAAQYASTFAAGDRARPAAMGTALDQVLY